ncbi:hypothetical protein TNIN_71111, partial [Trichonephila inaurata madagascariensis]
FDLILLQLLKTFHSTRVIIEFDAEKIITDESIYMCRECNKFLSLR